MFLKFAVITFSLMCAVIFLSITSTISNLLKKINTNYKKC